MYGYFDANATEPLRPQARQALLQASDLTGNPSSVHAAGREARRVLEYARTMIASLFDISGEQVILTSGGTEANALAINALGAGRRILYAATEHDSVRQAAREGEIIPVTECGELSLAGLETMLQQGGPALVCVMAANNETGVVNPIIEVAQICQFYGALLHVDAVQYAARWRLPLAGLASVSLSGHKAGGVKGAGALLLGQMRDIAPMMPGGGQERGRRGGTPGLPAIASMAAAFEAAHQQDWGRIAALRDRIEAMARACNAKVAGAEAALRLANTSCLISPGMSAQAQLMALDLQGFCVSTGSACSSGKVGASHVLTAMGLGDIADRAIRVSLPWCISEDDVTLFCQAYERLAQPSQKRSQ